MIKKYIESYRRKREPGELNPPRVLDLIFALAMAAGITPTKFANALNLKKIQQFLNGKHH